MTVKPVFSDDKKILYDLYSRFDKSPELGYDKSNISYGQTDDYATPMFHHKC